SAGASPYPVEKVVAELGHPNVWQRERAMKLILAGRMTNAVPLLQLALTNTVIPLGNIEFGDTIRASEPVHRDPAAAAHANLLNTAFALSGLAFESARHEQRLDESARASGMRGTMRAVISGIRHPHPGVRLTAWRWLGQAFANSAPPDHPDPFLVVAMTDPSPRIRFETVLIIGDWPDQRATGALVLLALMESEDKWARAAFLSGIHDREAEVVTALGEHVELPPSAELAQELGRYLAGREMENLFAGSSPILRAFTQAAAEGGWQLSALAGIIEGIGAREFLHRREPTWQTLGLDAASRLKVLAAARARLEPDTATPIEQAAAVTVLALAAAETGPLLLEHIKPGIAPDLARHILNLTLEMAGPADLERLTTDPLWSSLSPTSRAQVIDGLLRRESTADLLLDALQQDRLAAGALSLSQRDRLKGRVSSGRRETAARLFADVGGDRRKVYEQFKDTVAMPADAANGRELFKLHCASCHRLDREGFNVGPDLFGIRSQPKEAILMHVLVPNAEVYPGFAAVTIETRDGRALTGIIRSENGHSLTLIMAQGIAETVPRSDILSQQTGALSLMPDGFEALMSRQELA
ncbi:MAG TPA: hypothetical protein DCY13_21490, partial [Verrucomicrobiales bacterium]|nr:hypothetical protein [Verrucomicrobiales bacterium]